MTLETPFSLASKTGHQHSRDPLLPPATHDTALQTRQRASAVRRASLLLIDKPEGVTSHAVVAMARRALGEKRIGHLGTLDPFASGLLPLLVGGMTKLSDLLMDGQKRYLFQIALGTETDTLDGTGRIVASAPLPQDLSVAQCDDVLAAFRGKIVQTPPAYSALKHEGRPLYEYMRTQGQLNFDLETKARSIQIAQLINLSTPADYAAGHLTLDVTCSKGTYVRCLARDIARQLGTVGHCKTLRRLGCGSFNIADAVPVTLAAVRGELNHEAQKSLQDTLVSQLQSVADVLGGGPQAMAFFAVTGQEPWAPAFVRERLNAGNRVVLGEQAWESFLRSRDRRQDPRELADDPAADGSALPFCWPLGFVRTPEKLFLARFVSPDAAKQLGERGSGTIEPFKLIDQDDVCWS